jgi:hypothetical protein
MTETMGLESYGEPRGDVGRRDAADDAVRRRAYELYEARAGADGDDVADWLTAEREIAARRTTRPDDLGEPPHDDRDEDR